jgi:hypothetical protein
VNTVMKLLVLAPRSLLYSVINIIMIVFLSVILSIMAVHKTLML